MRCCRPHAFLYANSNIWREKGTSSFAKPRGILLPTRFSYSNFRREKEEAYLLPRINFIFFLNCLILIRLYRLWFMELLFLRPNKILIIVYICFAERLGNHLTLRLNHIGELDLTDNLLSDWAEVRYKESYWTEMPPECCHRGRVQGKQIRY